MVHGLGLGFELDSWIWDGGTRILLFASASGGRGCWFAVAASQAKAIAHGPPAALPPGARVRFRFGSWAERVLLGALHREM
jgi:hypothetical protein